MDTGRRQNVANTLGEDKQNGMVEPHSPKRSGDKHEKGEPGKLEIVRLGRRDALARRENDVRSTTKRNGLANVRRAKETGRAEKFHEGSSRNGLFQV